MNLRLASKSLAFAFLIVPAFVEWGRNFREFKQTWTVQVDECFRQISVDALNHDIVPDVAFDGTGKGRVFATEALPTLSVAR